MGIEIRGKGMGEDGEDFVFKPEKKAEVPDGERDTSVAGMAEEMRDMKTDIGFKELGNAVAMAAKFDSILDAVVSEDIPEDRLKAVREMRDEMKMQEGVIDMYNRIIPICRKTVESGRGHVKRIEDYGEDYKGELKDSENKLKEGVEELQASEDQLKKSTAALNETAKKFAGEVESIAEEFDLKAEGDASEEFSGTLDQKIKTVDRKIRDREDAKLEASIASRMDAVMERIREGDMRDMKTDIGFKELGNAVAMAAKFDSILDAVVSEDIPEDRLKAVREMRDEMKMQEGVIDMYNRIIPICRKTVESGRGHVKRIEDYGEDYKGELKDSENKLKEGVEELQASEDQLKKSTAALNETAKKFAGEVESIAEEFDLKAEGDASEEFSGTLDQKIKTVDRKIRDREDAKLEASIASRMDAVMERIREGDMDNATKMEVMNKILKPMEGVGGGTDAGEKREAMKAAEAALDEAEDMLGEDK